MFREWFLGFAFNLHFVLWIFRFNTLTWQILPLQIVPLWKWLWIPYMVFFLLLITGSIMDGSILWDVYLLLYFMISCSLFGYPAYESKSVFSRYATICTWILVLCEMHIFFFSKCANIPFSYLFISVFSWSWRAIFNWDFLELHVQMVDRWNSWKFTQGKFLKIFVFSSIFYMHKVILKFAKAT